MQTEPLGHDDIKFLPPNLPQIYGTPLHWISFTYRRMHTKSLSHDKIKFYPLQSTIDLWNTTMLIKFHI